MRRALLIALLAFAPVASAQEVSERVAEVYAFETWPKASPARVGIDPAGVAAPGFQSLGVRVDARRAEAQVRFCLADSPTKSVAAFVTLRRHKDAASARRALLARLGETQARLGREEGLGDVAFGLRRDGRLHTVTGAVGNLSYMVRSAGDEGDVQALAAALASLAAQAPALQPGQQVAPKIVACQVEGAVAQAPAPLRVDFDPSAPPAAYVAFSCSGGAGVVDTKAGYELYAGKAGTVTVTVFACSKLLATSAFKVDVTVR